MQGYTYAVRPLGATGWECLMPKQLASATCTSYAAGLGKPGASNSSSHGRHRCRACAATGSSFNGRCPMIAGLSERAGGAHEYHLLQFSNRPSHDCGLQPDPGARGVPTGSVRCCCSPGTVPVGPPPGQPPRQSACSAGSSTWFSVQPASMHCHNTATVRRLLLLSSAGLDDAHL